MIDLLDIRYVRLGTRDLVAADRFAREVVGLELVRVEAGAHYYRSDDRDHTLVYFEGDPRDHTVGFELRQPGALEAAAAELSNRGLAVRPGSADALEQRRVQGLVSFTDLTRQPHRPGRAAASQRPALLPVARRRHHRLQPCRAVQHRRAARRGLLVRRARRARQRPHRRRRAAAHRPGAPQGGAVPDHARRRAARQPPGGEHRRRDARLVPVARAGREDRLRPGPAPDLGRGVPVLRRAGRHGLRILHRRAPHRAGRRGELPAAAVSGVPSSFCMWGSLPDIPEFRKEPA